MGGRRLLNVARLEGEAAAGAPAALRLDAGEPPFARAGAGAGAAVVAREIRGIVRRKPSRCLTSLNRSSAFLRKAQRKQQSISENHTLLVLSISLQDTDNAWVYTSLGHRRHNMKEGRVD